MLYTQNTCLYPILNKELRDHADVEGKKAFLPYLKLLLTGLNKLPLVRVKVYRGIKADVHDVYNQLKDKVFTWWAFSSTSTRQNQAEVFLHGSESTLFTIDAIGVDIAAFSSYPNEQEVLLLPGTRLTVESGVIADAGYWSYELSVWRAAQQQRQHDDDHEDNDQDELDDDQSSKTENLEGKNTDAMIINETYGRMSRFQNIDLPHPGWDTISFSVPSVRSTGAHQ